MNIWKQLADQIEEFGLVIKERFVEVESRVETLTQRNDELVSHVTALLQKVDLLESYNANQRLITLWAEVEELKRTVVKRVEPGTEAAAQGFQIKGNVNEAETVKRWAEHMIRQRKLDVNDRYCPRCAFGIASTPRIIGTTHACHQCGSSWEWR